ncbi:hypothetical protein PIROE2DRAFT_45397, partial [Piromyces sp. E2]
ESWKELSFLFNNLVPPEIRLTGERVVWLAKHSSFGIPGAFLTVLENPGEIIIFIPSRTHNRSRSPRLTASN